MISIEMNNDELELISKRIKELQDELEELKKLKKEQ